MVVQVGFGYSLTFERTGRRRSSIHKKGWKWWCSLSLATAYHRQNRQTFVLVIREAGNGGADWVWLLDYL
jgi:hypothetical protein